MLRVRNKVGICKGEHDRKEKMLVIPLLCCNCAIVLLNLFSKFINLSSLLNRGLLDA